MNQNVIFLTSAKTGNQFAMLNLSQFCYIEGAEDTEEYPEGSKSVIYFHGGARTIDHPYRALADQISEMIKKNYTNYYQIDEMRAEKHRKEIFEGMERIISGAHHS